MPQKNVLVPEKSNYFDLKSGLPGPQKGKMSRYPHNIYYSRFQFEEPQFPIETSKFPGHAPSVLIVNDYPTALAVTCPLFRGNNLFEE